MVGSGIEPRKRGGGRGRSGRSKGVPKNYTIALLLLLTIFRHIVVGLEESSEVEEEVARSDHGYSL